MRKVTKQTCEAFQNFQKLGVGNTVSDGERLLLHGHRIAYWGEDGKLYISTCGWDTVTTRERLNGLNGVHVYKKRGELYLNGKLWDGNEVCVGNTV